MIALSQCPGIDPVKDSSAALQAAVNLKQPITADCPVNLVMGSDATKGIFLPPGTDITFTPKGRFDTDAFGFPTLCFMHADGIIRNGNLRYVGGSSVVQPRSGSDWTNGPARNYLLKNGLNPSFTGVGGTLWTSPTNTAAMLSIRGLSNVNLAGLKISVPDDVPSTSFALVGVGIDHAYAPGAPATPTAALVAANVTITDFIIDGVLMGVVGGGSKVTLQRIKRERYADLQDAAGNVAPAGTSWFAPPHWLYMGSSPSLPMTLIIEDAIDNADYRGSALRRSTSTGYANSIKVPLDNGSRIRNLYSRCRDGGLGILGYSAATGGTVENATCIVDTSIRSVDGKACCTGAVFFPHAAAAYAPSTISMLVHDVAGGNPVTSSNLPPPNITLNLTVQQ